MHEKMMQKLRESSRKHIKEMLKDVYGLEFRQQIFASSKDKLRIFSNSISFEDLARLERLLRIEAIGMYFAFFKKQELRLSFDAAILFAKDIKKNILEISEKHAEEWMSGQEILIEKKHELAYPFAIMKNNDDVLGVGKITQERILNFVPKERRTI